MKIYKNCGDCNAKTDVLTITLFNVQKSDRPGTQNNHRFICPACAEKRGPIAPSGEVE